MKKSILIAAIIIIIVVFILRKANKFRNVIFDFDDIRLKTQGIADYLKLALSGADADISIALSNYGNSPVTIDNIYLEIYDNDVLTAYQTKPLAQKIVIQPNSQTKVAVPFFLKNIFFTKIISGAKFNEFLKTGKLGKKLNVSGFLVIGGVKVNIPNIEKTI